MAALEKHGTYNPKHNDRSFEITNSEHIDPERVQQNIYWDCYNGIRSALQPKDVDSLADTFEEVEKLYYKLHYTNFTERQNERNAKIRHTERNRSTEDLLASKKTCPEESIYQLGTLESHASPKELFQIATEFMDEFHERFGISKQSRCDYINYCIYIISTIPYGNYIFIWFRDRRILSICNKVFPYLLILYMHKLYTTYYIDIFYFYRKTHKRYIFIFN